MVVSPYYFSEQVPDVPIHQVMFKQFNEFRDNIALVNDETDQRYTYAQLFDNIQRFACGLYKLGVKKGDIVALFSPNTIDYPVWLFAALSVGATITSANPHYTKYEFGYHVKDSTAKYIITQPSHLDTVKSVAADSKGQVKGIICENGGPGTVSPSSLLSTDPRGIWERIMSIPFQPAEDVAIMPYSSGTTGLPKGVMITHRNLVANLMQNLHPELLPPPESAPVEPGVVLGLLPFYHAYGLIGVCHLALMIGSTIVVMDHFKPRRFLGAIQKYKITILALVPSLVIFLSKSELVKEYDLSSVMAVNSGAAPLSPEADDEFREKLPTVPILRQGFGMTETTLSALAHGVQREIKPGSVGTLVPGTEANIIDVDTGRLLGPRERGELVIRGPQIMKGYWNKPEATSNTIDQFGFLHTGDVAYYDEDGYFYIVDRIKELIKCKGFQVAPAELEGILLTHPLVADAGVTGIPHPTHGEVPRAYVTLKPGNSPGKRVEDDIKAYVAERVSDYKRLDGGLIFVPEVPRSPSGKILRRTLKEMAKSKL